MSSNQNDIVISLVETEQDLRQANWLVSEAFARQAKDAVWMAVNQGWDTEEGQALASSKMIKRWQTTTYNKDGKPNTIFVKATLPDPTKEGERKVVGLAIWQQLSYVDGYGDPFTGDVSEMVESLDESTKRFAAQVFASLWKRRIEYLREVSSSNSGRNPPAIFTLDLCAVDPAFQRRGIAGKLVQFGLEEAKQRGNLECTTEGSSMGREVYRRLGFKDENVGDIVYEIDEEFKHWDMPPNVFLRTGA
jgi:aminocarboxymuconate-semialdehyde decarboxylase